MKLVHLLRKDESTLLDLPKAWKYAKDHPREQILGDTSAGIQTRSRHNLMCFYAYISILEPKSVESVLEDSSLDYGNAGKNCHNSRGIKFGNLFPNPHTKR